MKISIKQIKKEMPDDLTPIEKVRYIYLKLGNIFSYNRDFLNITNYKILEDIYNDYITISMIEEGNYQNKITATCKQHAEITSEVINSINEKLDARTIGYVEGEQNHIEVIVTIEEKRYCLDISKDLYKIPKGLKTKGFARESKAVDGSKCDVLPEEELKKIDEKIGYCKYSMYTDDIIQLLKKEMEQEKNWEKYSDGKPKSSAFHYKLDFIFKHLKNNELEQDQMGVWETHKYYKMLYYRLLTKEEIEQNKLRVLEIILNKEKSILYEIQMKQGNLYYIYSHEEKTFIETTEAEIIRLQENGNLKYEGILRPHFESQERQR